MAMDWDRSGDDAGAAAWRLRMHRLELSPQRADAMVFGTDVAVTQDEKLNAFHAWMAHVDAGRIGGDAALIPALIPALVPALIGA